MGYAHCKAGRTLYILQGSTYFVFIVEYVDDNLMFLEFEPGSGYMVANFKIYFKIQVMQNIYKFLRLRV